MSLLAETTGSGRRIFFFLMTYHVNKRNFSFTSYLMEMAKLSNFLNIRVSTKFCACFVMESLTRADVVTSDRCGMRRAGRNQQAVQSAAHFFASEA